MHGARRFNYGWGVYNNMRRSHESHRNAVFTIFVDNLPPTVAKRDLFTEFRRDGNVTDIFVSRKHRVKSPWPFAFVRFDKLVSARGAIERMNGRAWQGKMLHISMSRYNRNDDYRDKEIDAGNNRRFLKRNAYREKRGVWKWVEVKRMNESKTIVEEVTLKKEVPIKSKRKVVELQKSDIQFERLSRSLLGISVKPIEFRRVMNYLLDEWKGPGVIECRDVSPYRCLVTFSSPKIRDEAMGNELLQSVFDEDREFEIFVKEVGSEVYSVESHPNKEASNSATMAETSTSISEVEETPKVGGNLNSKDDRQPRDEPIVDDKSGDALVLQTDGLVLHADGDIEKPLSENIRVTSVGGKGEDQERDVWVGDGGLGLDVLFGEAYEGNEVRSKKSGNKERWVDPEAVDIVAQTKKSLIDACEESGRNDEGGGRLNDMMIGPDAEDGSSSYTSCPFPPAEDEIELNSEDEELKAQLAEVVTTKEVCARGGVDFEKSDEEEVLVRLVGRKVVKKGGSELRPRRPKPSRAPCIEGRTITTGFLRVLKSNRWIMLKGRIIEKDFGCCICVVYGPHTREERTVFWDEIRYAREEMGLPTLIAGDFNEILQLGERKGGTVLSPSSAMFREWVDVMELIDLELMGRKYT
ncbi:hypothetical protein PIB30_014275 [Stylosanthes scabra]|uniref:RRM domain-containing protein n=1 Tax=Stylosanthes scabra TaxID=79078 RepID=A0ABU6Z565_9FABA|nr:hypothetical protein [Stylosanthes scabra]